MYIISRVLETSSYVIQVRLKLVKKSIQNVFQLPASDRLLEHGDITYIRQFHILRFDYNRIFDIETASQTTFSTFKTVFFL